MKVLFLDIDGVLNDLEYNERAQSNVILPRCVDLLNEILIETDAKIVLTSSWRYMVHKEAMTVKGFEYLLQSHGIVPRLIGITMLDEDTPPYYDAENWCRSQQVQIWLNENKELNIENFVVMDDFDISFDGLNGRFIQTNAETGMTGKDVAAAIKILNGI